MIEAYCYLQKQRFKRNLVSFIWKIVKYNTELKYFVLFIYFLVPGIKPSIMLWILVKCSTTEIYLQPKLNIVIMKLI